MRKDLEEIYDDFYTLFQSIEKNKFTPAEWDSLQTDFAKFEGLVMSGTLTNDELRSGMLALFDRSKL